MLPCFWPCYCPLKGFPLKVRPFVLKGRLLSTFPFSEGIQRRVRRRTGPFAADHRSGCKLGRRSHHPVDCHAQMVQCPSNAPLPELGEASLAVALVGSPVTSRIASQAHPVLPGGCLTFLPLRMMYACIVEGSLIIRCHSATGGFSRHMVGVVSDGG